jgi:hypothetical protein
MIINWLFLLLAVGLLLPPPMLAPWLHKYLMKPRRNVTPAIRSLVSRWQNWADLIRAGVGVYLLTELAIRPTPGVPGAETKCLVFEGTVLTLVLLAQIVRINPGIQLMAPVFYLSGLTLVLSGYTSGGFAVFVGWLFAIGGQNPAYQLPVMGVALAVGGYLLGLTSPLILNSVLIFLPLLLGFLFRRDLLFVAKAPRFAEPSSSSTKQPLSSDAKSV